MFLLRFIIVVSLFIVSACNRNLTEEEKEELWSKAQTRQAIIDRSGTKFNSAMDPELALRDAETRLQSGGGLLGKKGLSLDMLGREKSNVSSSASSVAMPVNVYLWRSALETLSFMPLNSADPIGGTILTDWYSTSDNISERCKLNIFINGKDLKTQNLKVTSFCQKYTNNIWVSTEVNPEDNVKIENAILNKAKKIRLESS